MAEDKGYSGNAVSGEKYEQGRYRSAAEIAKGVRADIKAAIKVGALPDVKYSVRSESFAGGQAVRIRVPEVSDDEVFEPAEEGYPHFGRKWSEKWRQASIKLYQIGNAYTRRDIDLMTDYFNVSCYITVSFAGGLSGPSH